MPFDIYAAFSTSTAFVNTVIMKPLLCLNLLNVVLVGALHFPHHHHHHNFQQLATPKLEIVFPPIGKRDVDEFLIGSSEIIDGSMVARGELMIRSEPELFRESESVQMRTIRENRAT